MKKPDTTRNPLAVLEWVVLQLTARGVQLDAYHDMVGDAVVVFDYTTEPPTKRHQPRSSGNAIAAELLARHAPDLTMPAPYVGNHSAARRAQAKATVAAPPPAPQPTQAELRARAQTPLDRAMANGLGRQPERRP
jgi:hypothetical protein